MAKLDISVIQKGQIRLRLLRESDLPITLVWRNQDHIRKWFIHSEIILREQHQKWFEGYLQRDNDYIFIIEEAGSYWRPVGQISLYNIDWDQRHGEFGRFLIGEKNTQVERIGERSTKLLLNYAFTVLGLERIDLVALSGNSQAIAIYRACGFYEVSNVDGLVKMVNIGNDFKIH